MLSMKDGSVPSFQKVLCVAVCLMLISGTLPEAARRQEGYAPLSPADLESLVAPIALYPDELVAQVSGAATYPEQITEAHDWLQWNSGLQGQALMWGDPRSTINNETHVPVKSVSPSKNSL
jgi:Protein of unknown function (DUF3300)